MTRLEFAIFEGHYSLPIHLLGPSGPISEPVLAFFDTGASKCGIPKEANKVFNLPVIDHDDNVRTAKDKVGYDVVRIPTVNLMKLDFKPPSTVQFLDTDLQEANVEAWLCTRYIIGMNLISKFDIELKRNGRIVITR